jgi:YbbR domain-containing protein
MAVVVSEESGRIVAAKGNQIHAIHRKQRLSELLLTHIGQGPDQSTLVKREKFKGIAAAVISLLIVTGIWFSVSRGLYTMITVDVPIEYMNLKPEMEIFETSTNSLQLHLSGSGALIKSVRPEQIRVKIDLNRAVAGKNVFTISPNNIVLPPGVVLKKVDPSVVEASLDIPVTKVLPIQADWIGRLPPNVILTQARLKPETVQIIGPEFQLKQTSTIFTEKIKLDDLEKSGRLRVNLAVEAGNYKVAPGSPDKVTIEYTLENRLIE